MEVRFPVPGTATQGGPLSPRGHSSLSKAWFLYGAASPRRIALGALRGTPARLGSLRDTAGTLFAGLGWESGKDADLPRTKC